jgi:DnaJ-class molecular chaperone
MNFATFPDDVKAIFIKKCRPCRGQGSYYGRTTCSACNGTGKDGLTARGREFAIEVIAELITHNNDFVEAAMKLRDSRREVNDAGADVC